MCEDSLVESVSKIAKTSSHGLQVFPSIVSVLRRFHMPGLARCYQTPGQPTVSPYASHVPTLAHSEYSSDIHFWHVQNRVVWNMTLFCLASDFMAFKTNSIAGPVHQYCRGHFTKTYDYSHQGKTNVFWSYNEASASTLWQPAISNVLQTEGQRRRSFIEEVIENTSGRYIWRDIVVCASQRDTQWWR